MCLIKHIMHDVGCLVAFREISSGLSRQKIILQETCKDNSYVPLICCYKIFQEYYLI